MSTFFITILQVMDPFKVLINETELSHCYIYQSYSTQVHYSVKYKSVGHVISTNTAQYKEQYKQYKQYKEQSRMKYTSAVHGAVFYCSRLPAPLGPVLAVADSTLCPSLSLWTLYSQPSSSGGISQTSPAVPGVGVQLVAGSCVTHDRFGGGPGRGSRRFWQNNLDSCLLFCRF